MLGAASGIRTLTARLSQRWLSDTLSAILTHCVTFLSG